MPVQEISQFGRRGRRPIVFVLNNCGYLSCQGWFTARVRTCGELDDALETVKSFYNVQ